jgi:hypothetical protein
MPGSPERRAGAFEEPGHEGATGYMITGDDRSFEVMVSLPPASRASVPGDEQVLPILVELVKGSR